MHKKLLTNYGYKNVAKKLRALRKMRDYMELNNKIKFVSKLLENLDEVNRLKELNKTQKNLRKFSLYMLCESNGEKMEILEKECDIEKTKKMIYDFLKVFLHY